MTEVTLNLMLFQKLRLAGKAKCSNHECSVNFVLGQRVVRTANSPRKHYCLGCFYTEPRSVPRDDRIIIDPVLKPYSRVKERMRQEGKEFPLKLSNIRKYY